MIQPSEIEEYFKEKKCFDSMGWTGEYHVSAKDIIDLLIDLKNNQNDSDKKNGKDNVSGDACSAT
jgi:hypothetical protein